MDTLIVGPIITVALNFLADMLMGGGGFGECTECMP